MAVAEKIKVTKPEHKAEKESLIPVGKIVADERAQIRVKGIDSDIVKNYLEIIQDGRVDEFPPLVVYKEKGKHTYWLSDGFHRLAAMIMSAGSNNEVAEVRCVVRDGTIEDAIFNALGSNRDHGLHRSTADKSAAATKLIQLKPDWSARKIADYVGVTHPTVTAIQRKLNPPAAPEPSANGTHTPPADGPTETTVLESKDQVDGGDEVVKFTSPTATEPVTETSQEPTIPADQPTEKPVAVVPPTQVDDWGIPIQPHAVAAFAALPQFKELIAAINTARKLFDDVANLPGGHGLTTPELSRYNRTAAKNEAGEYVGKYLHEGLEAALRQVKAMVPSHTVCPWSYVEAPHPTDCKTCHGLNWTSELSKNIPPEAVANAKAAFGVV